MAKKSAALKQKSTEFDYGSLPEDIHHTVKTWTTHIKLCLRTVAQDIVLTGKGLSEVQSHLGYGKFGEWLKTELGMGRTTAHRFIRVYEQFSCSNLEQLDIAASALYLLASPSTPKDARQEALKRAREGENITPAKAKQIVNGFKNEAEDGAVNHQTDSQVSKKTTDDENTILISGVEIAASFITSKSDEHYTPRQILERVTECLGEIALDPCSNSYESPNVAAARHYTKKDNGLAQNWNCTSLFMNPPYSEIKQWLEKLITEYKAGKVVEAIALVKADTSTKWFRPLWSYPICFIYEHLSYNDKPDSASFASALVYFGAESEKFSKAFRELGHVVLPLVKTGMKTLTEENIGMKTLTEEDVVNALKCRLQFLKEFLLTNTTPKHCARRKNAIDEVLAISEQMLEYAARKTQNTLASQNNHFDN